MDKFFLNSSDLFIPKFLSEINLEIPILFTVSCKEKVSPPSPPEVALTKLYFSEYSLIYSISFKYK